MDIQTDIAARKERWQRFLANDEAPRFLLHDQSPMERPAAEGEPADE